MPHVLLAGAPTGCWSNLGDEAILSTMVASLRRAIPDVDVSVVSSNPDGFLDAYGATAVAFADVDALATAVANSDLVLLGGGSIFFDYWGVDASSVLTPRHHGVALWTGIALLAAAYDTPLMVYGAGVGPLDGDDGRLQTGACFELAHAVTVRDNAAAAALADLGFDTVTPVVTADPAVGATLPDVAAAASRGPVLGVAVRPWDIDADPATWTAAVAAAADRFVDDTGGSVRFVPCHRPVNWPLADDTAAAEAVRAQMRHAERSDVVDVTTPWSQRAALLGRCDVVVAMRYHAALFALAAGVPTVGLTYDPKVTGLFADLGLDDVSIPVGDVDADTLAAAISRAAGGDVSAATAERVAGLRDVEAANAATAAELVGRDGPRRLGGAGVGRLLERLSSPPDDMPPVARAALGHLRRRRAGRGDVAAHHDAAPRTVAILTNRVLDRVTGEPCIGGAERYVLELARLLVDVGLAPTIFQLGDGHWDEGDYFGIPVVALPRGEVSGEFEIGVTDAFHERTAAFDHVIVNAPNYAAGALRDDAVVVFHGVWWDHDLWEHLEFRTPSWYEHLAAVVGRAERVVSVDANSLNVVRALMPSATGSMTHIPNFVDTERFHPPATPRDASVPLVLFPRRADVIRGTRLVEPILAAVPDPLRARWVGDGPLLPELVDVTTREHRLEVTTSAFDDMPEEYRAADICVIPTVASEGQSLACLEAMASGCAVVATRVGGLPELIDDGVDGLLCDPTPESISAALARLVRDPVLRQRLGAAARDKAERFSLAAWRHRWTGLLADLDWFDARRGADPFDVVCFSICNWDFRWQRPQQMMDRWAQRGRRVFVLRVDDHLPVGAAPFAVTPLGKNTWEVRLALPDGFDPLSGTQPDGSTAAGVDALAALAAHVGIDAAVSVVEIAGWHPMAAAVRDRLGWPVVYDCMDDWSSWPGFEARTGFLDVETELVASADLVVASSHTIARRWSPTRPDLLLARNAADFDFFHAAGTADAGSDPLADVTGPVAGFFGAVVEWFDVDVVRHAAESRRDVTFVFAGDVRRVSVDSLAALPNVRFLGPQPYETLPALLDRFDVALIPFEVSSVTDGMDVVKLYEYLAQGTPVVSTPIREVVPYGELVYLASTPEEFVTQLDRALAEHDDALVARRIELARQHSWDERLDRIEERLRTLDATVGGVRSLPQARRRERELLAQLDALSTTNHHLTNALDAVHRSRGWRLLRRLRPTR